MPSDFAVQSIVPITTYLKVPLQMDKATASQKIFKSLDSFLQMTFHMETARSRAILAKERRARGPFPSGSP